ncbi:MAG: type II secretion system GspH family protein [Candidatus Pacebacteria bacterium]|nr:type II secretion system GspH family protein [Candidatus Paceibacterota bacterium]
MTFIELVVVIGIFATIAGVVLFNFTGFSTNISVDNLAQDIALRIKNAQTESISGKFAPGFTTPLVPSYGVHFDSTTPSMFTYFADLDNDGLLTGVSACGTPGAECLEQISIQSGDRIQALCVNEQSGFPNCGIPINDVSVTFKRPFPDAIVSTLSLPNRTSISDVQIKIVSAKGKEKIITVWPTGQISVQ